MFEIDKQKFSCFLTELRKEKGLTQKDIAHALFISDKAVSKWERGASLPDIALLMPLSELLEISVAELLTCQRASSSASPPPCAVSPESAQEIPLRAKSSIIFFPDEPADSGSSSGKWGIVYFC